MIGEKHKNLSTEKRIYTGRVANRLHVTRQTIFKNGEKLFDSRC